MASRVVAETTSSRKKGPKALAHIEIHPQLGGGHTVKHVYSGYGHDAREYNFGADEGDRAASHIARHTGIPIAAKQEDGDSAAEEG